MKVGTCPQTDILQISGFKHGSLPFKYLGIPISSKNLTKNEGRKLIDKITARIRAWVAKHLSYAGMLTLVTSVLHTLHSYWASIFLIPNCIMNRIYSICRNYLWGGGTDSYMHAPAINWEKYCSPKEEGGLGLKNAKTWNTAMLGKYVWWVASKKDHLWVRWINHVYLKGSYWTHYTPPNDCSWSWKKIAHIMAKFRNAYNSDLWLGTPADYSIKAWYKWMRQRLPRIPWWRICWNSMNVTRTSFIFWVVMLGRLLTRDRLVRMGGGPDMNCYLCQSADENHDHLFFECTFSKRCVTLMQLKLQVDFSPNDIIKWNSRGRRDNILIRKIVCACHVHLAYLIWQARNKARVMNKVIHPRVIVHQAIQGVLTRVWARNTSAIPTTDET
ncbi:uncharacterized protein LOC141613657 [Silene latifolia]|uniref:uncharacterized protein LOC141613657 n=1 Tax=Silene latifolia TaxID=37657 RepID=UPI003D76F9F2